MTVFLALARRTEGGMIVDARNYGKGVMYDSLNGSNMPLVGARRLL